MPMKKCNYVGCRQYIDNRSAYCDEHKKQKNKEYDKEVRQQTQHDIDIRKFYKSKSWKNIRKRKITEQPLCEICLQNKNVKQAEIIHHVVEVRDDWDKRLDYDNLQSVCRACHNTLHGGTKKHY